MTGHMPRLGGLLLALGLLCGASCVAQPPPGALQPGDKAPDFTLSASDGQQYQLSQFAGRKAVAICWFPRAGSQGAKNQCASLQAVLSRLPADRLQVFGCSTAALDATVQFGQDGKYGFPVLSDADHAAARAYGCLRPDGLSERWVFLIDDKGLVTAINKSTSPQTAGADLVQMLTAAGLLDAGAPAVQAAAGDQTLSLQVGALTRTCLLHLPAGYDGKTPLPLVIAMHGARGNGRGMAALTGFNALADKHAFLVAYPDGVAGDHTWNALFGRVPGGEGVLADDIDDVAFLRTLIATVQERYHADPRRVFTCGHSAGAYMAYRAAVELSDLIAASGIVNGSLGLKSRDSKPCQDTIPAPAGPVSLIHICGKLDRTVRFEGGQTPKNLFRSVPDCVCFFVQANGCAPQGADTRDEANAVSRTTYSGGKAGTEVVLVVVDNCNHNWPTPAVGLPASQTLWDFFSTHPKAP